MQQEQAFHPIVAVSPVLCKYLVSYLDYWYGIVNFNRGVTSALIARKLKTFMLLQNQCFFCCPHVRTKHVFFKPPARTGIFRLQIEEE